MQSAQGSLVFIGLNTNSPQAFFNGVKIENITEIKTDWENDEQRVKLKVSTILPIHEELRLSGVTVKVGGNHE